MKRIREIRSRWLVLAAVVLTLLGVVLVQNLSGGEAVIEKRFARTYALEDPRFAYELGALLGPPFVQGNRVQLLRNGDEIFPAMLQAIREARRSVNFETYIYWSGEIGKTFAEALSARARDGVQVHVLLDWVGSKKMEPELLEAMKAAGVQVQRYHPPRLYDLDRLNHRTHRKLLVVDGRLAFTGGVGIAPEWTGDAQDPDHWRDSHFRLEGPAVAQMQAVFNDNWIKTTGEVLHGEDYFPTLPRAGDSAAQMFSSSPTGGSESMQLMYLMAITSAQDTIDLSASYFVPDPMMTRALLDAMKRGVRLRVVVPGEHIDSELVRRASRAKWGPLLQAGATIAEYAPTMYHCKVLIVDGLLVSVGSTNFDNRSFRLNDEATLNVLDRDFARAQTAVFEQDLDRSEVVTYDAWRQRPWRERAGEWVGELLSSQL